ncbi:hypothetical protein [Mycobacterium sp. 141]|uniref:hypothetical protein n=1 Tax=Mycobacterium sp. 141 TaxID=1120797 RepID=UPI000368ED13|nr:hypothetical protein [Mycobacterium sp. 141]
MFFVVTGAIGFLLQLVTSSNNRQRERRFFWTGFIIVAVSAFFIAYPPDAKSGLLWLAFASFLMLSRAYMMTSNIKIRGKIYAFHVDDSRPDPSPDGSPPSSDTPDYDPAPDSYSGFATAGKTWTLLILTMAICSLNVVIYVTDKERPLLALVLAALLVALAAGFGYGDAIWEYPIARGQHIQFFIISIITAGVFTVLYLAAYFTGKRWPRRNKRSMEYRAHPRHQQKWS